MPPKKSAVNEALSELEALGISNPAETFADLSIAMVRQAAQKAAEPLPTTGPLRGLPTGEIEICLADTVIRLRTPTVGEDQIMVELFAAEGFNTLDWWRKAAELLGDAPLPANESLPGWLKEEDTLPFRSRKHWNTLPTVAPGT